MSTEREEPTGIRRRLAHRATSTLYYNSKSLLQSASEVTSLPEAGGEPLMSSLPDRKMVQPDGTSVLHVDKVAQPRRTGLFLPTEMPIERWKRLGEQISLVSEASAWWLGDWLVYGQKKYGNRYRMAIAETSLEYQTLRNYAWIARRFKISRRRARLSFQHHVEVAPLCEPEQNAWLDRAERFGWSRNKLRSELKKSLAAQATDDGHDVVAKQEVQLRLEVPSERQRQWQEAAQRASCELAEWIIGTLDRAAIAMLRNH